jgi:hypothetical protein
MAEAQMEMENGSFREGMAEAREGWTTGPEGRIHIPRRL